MTNYSIMQISLVEQGLLDYYEKSNPEYKDIKILNVKRMTEGWDTLVYEFSIRFVNEEKDITKNLILRLYPGKDGKRRANDEFNILTSLMLSVVPIPDVYRLELAYSPFEFPMIIMERIDGPLLSQYLREHPDESERLLKHFAKILVDIHEMDWSTIIHNADKYAAPDPYKYIVNTLNHYKDLIELHDKKEFIPVLRWLVERMDQVPNNRLSFMHNDYHIGNVILGDEQEFFIIDWVNAAVGDFRADLAWTLVTHETVLNKNVRDVIFNYYRGFASYEVEDIEYFEVLACLRRLLDISIHFSYGSEYNRLNPDISATEINLDPVKRTLDLLYGLTRIKIPEFRQML